MGRVRPRIGKRSGDRVFCSDGLPLTGAANVTHQNVLLDCREPSLDTDGNAMMPLVELRSHLHTLADQPDWIPYRTSYYAESWGFCLTHRQLSSLGHGLYRVVIDSDLAPGHLSYGELVIPGDTDDTVLFSTHICHPSLANDNLSGIAVATMLARYLQSFRLH